MVSGIYQCCGGGGDPRGGGAGVFGAPIENSGPVLLCGLYSIIYAIMEPVAGSPIEVGKARLCRVKEGTGWRQRDNVFYQM